MMGTHEEASGGNNGGGGGGGGGQNQKATFSGLTALIGILTFIVAIISVAVPHWGYYSPYSNFGNVASNRPSGYPGLSPGYGQENSGHFGPFLSCKYLAYYHSFCQGNTYFTPTIWLTVAGVCAIIVVLAIGGFCLFAVLHVAMQLQRRQIWVDFQKALFLKLITASVAVIASVAAVALGALQFQLGRRNSGLYYSIGICYYLQIVLIFVNALLVCLAYLSYRKGRKHPILMVPRSTASRSSAYEVRSNGVVSMTSASGIPYQHGQPRFPTQIPASSTYAQQQQQQQQQQFQQGINGSPPAAAAAAAAVTSSGYTNNGFTPVSLSVPSSQQQMQVLQPIRTIQPGVAQVAVPQQPAYSQQQFQQLSPQQQQQYQLPIATVAPSIPVPTVGVSFMPAGSSKSYHKMAGDHVGSMESLDSTQSISLSIGSLGSSTSTGSAHGPLRPSLKKPKNTKDKGSISSECSSKRVRLSLGAEQTTV